ncbi:DHH family phosphoesterase [bacterium]|nr:DHH family phosphoesterase [bacterium]
MAKASDRARTRLARLLHFVRGHRTAVVAVQDHPDPDGIACAAALKLLLEKKARIDVTLAATGEVVRAENRAALQFLGETLVDTASLDLAAFDLRALVDTQPGFGNCFWPDDVEAHIVIDHHPRGPRVTADQFTDIRTDYGAAATILTEYLRAADIEPNVQLATALLYGIKTDTQNLSRGASDADTDAFLYLYPRANHRALAKIERERLPRDYFATLARALADCRIYGNVAICNLGPIPAPDILGEMADFFLRIQGIRWVLVHGLVENRLHLSVRTDLRQGKAGDLAAALLDDIGSGGGHGMLAGGQAHLPTDVDDDGETDTLEETVREIELRFLRLIEVPTRTPERLIPKATADTAGEPNT